MLLSGISRLRVIPECFCRESHDSVSFPNASVGNPGLYRSPPKACGDDTQEVLNFLCVTYAFARRQIQNKTQTQQVCVWSVPVTEQGRACEALLVLRHLRIFVDQKYVNATALLALCLFTFKLALEF